MAFLRFAKESVDIGLIETGLGGRLDATNIVNPELSIITSISHDHTELLGDTLTKIAGEKAGIIKPGKPVLIGCLPKEAEVVMRTTAEARGCKLYCVRDASPKRTCQRQILQGTFNDGMPLLLSMRLSYCKNAFPLRQTIPFNQFTGPGAGKR